MSMLKQNKTQSKAKKNTRHSETKENTMTSKRSKDAGGERHTAQPPTAPRLPQTYTTPSANTQQNYTISIAVTSNKLNSTKLYNITHCYKIHLRQC